MGFWLHNHVLLYKKQCMSICHLFSTYVWYLYAMTFLIFLWNFSPHSENFKFSSCLEGFNFGGTLNLLRYTLLSISNACHDFKGFVHYIFASLFLSLKEHLWNKKKKFFIWLQKLLDIQTLWHHQMPKHKTRNTYYWITWEANTVCWWNLASLCDITQEFFGKIFYQHVHHLKFLFTEDSLKIKKDLELASKSHFS